jgi:hypothetical protein
MKILKTHFRKNDLYYTLIYRNDKVAIYETRQDEDSDLCHYEVTRIYIKPAHAAVGVDFEETEVLTSNEKFYYDGSGSFIKRDNAIEKAGDLDHSSSELIDHIMPVVCICYHVGYIFGH